MLVSMFHLLLQGKGTTRLEEPCLGGLEVAVHSIGLWLWLRQVLHCRKG